MNLRRSNDLESARRARRNVHIMSLRLVNPSATTLESCTPHLRAAIEALESLQRGLAAPSPVTGDDTKALKAELHELRRELRHVNALMKQAAGYHAALAELLSPDDTSINYAASGRIKLRAAASTMAVEG